MRCRFRDDAGSVTAEFALALPAVVLVLAACLAGIQVLGAQVRLQDAAGLAARSVARGDGMGVASARVAALVPGATLDSDGDGELVCVTVSAPSGTAGLVIRARSCALGGSA